MCADATALFPRRINSRLSCSIPGTYTAAKGASEAACEMAFARASSDPAVLTDGQVTLIAYVYMHAAPAGNRLTWFEE